MYVYSMYRSYIVINQGVMASRKSEQHKWTWTNETPAAVHLVRQPVRMRCLEICLHVTDCRAVSYRTTADHDENCALYDQQPTESNMIQSSEWNMLIFL